MKLHIAIVLLIISAFMTGCRGNTIEFENAKARALTDAGKDSYYTVELGAPGEEISKTQITVSLNGKPVVDLANLVQFLADGEDVSNQDYSGYSKHIRGRWGEGVFRYYDGGIMVFCNEQKRVILVSLFCPARNRGKISLTERESGKTYDMPLKERELEELFGKAEQHHRYWRK